MRIALPLLALLLVGSPEALAQSGTRIVQHRVADFLDGELDGLALDPAGALVVAPVSQTRYFTPALYVWSLALDREGRVLAGTGDDGGVVRGDEDGFDELATLPGELVMSVADSPSGVLAATGPEGRVYRIDDEGNVDTVLDRDETTAWSLARAADGERWLAGFGPEAVLVRFDPDEPGRGEVIQTVDASVVRQLVRDDDRLWMVTQGPSLVFRGESDRAEQLRHDAGENEIPAAVPDGDGGLWFLILDPGNPDQMEPPSSRLMHLPAEGSALEVWGGNLALMSLARTSDGALLAGEIGASRVHRITSDGRIGLWRDFGAGDASALLADGERTWVGSSNLGDLFLLAAPGDGRGDFTSPPIPTRAVDRWGRLWTEGRGDGVRFAVRSGIRSEPDASWTEWSDWRDPGERFDVALGDYLQYRLRVEDSEVSGVRVSWARRNHAPRIGAVRFERPDGDEWSGGGNPASVYGGSGGANSAAIVRGVARVVVDAIDPDTDPVDCRVTVRSLPDGEWYPLGGEGLSVDWDTTQFGDGRWEARAEVSDRRERADGQSTTMLSAPVIVDNTAPRLRRVRTDDTTLHLEVEDEGSRIAQVELRQEGEEKYRRLEPVDGVTDSSREEFALPRPAEGTALWIRVRDAAGNETVVSPRVGD